MSGLNGIIDAFVEAADETFGRMAMFSVKVEAVESASESEDIFDYVGIIDFPGDCSGLVALCLDRSLAEGLASGMLGMEPDEVDSYCSAGVAELLNMIAGSAKKRLSETAFRFEISIPKVAENAKMPVTNETGLPSVWIRCRVGDERCHILVTMKGVNDGV